MRELKRFEFVKSEKVTPWELGNQWNEDKTKIYPPNSFKEYKEMSRKDRLTADRIYNNNIRSEFY